MTDEQLGRMLYEYTSRGWPKPFGWENMSKGNQALWIERAKKKIKEEPYGGG